VANKHATGKSAKHPVAPTIRRAFLRALGIIENEGGLTFSEMMRDAIREHGLLTVMDKVARYRERTNDVNLATGETLVDALTRIAEAEGRSDTDTGVESQSELGEAFPIKSMN